MDDELLAAAKRAQEHLVEADHAAELAKAQFHRAVRRLQLSGASLRELAAALNLSHQRVHQIVEGPVGVPVPSFGRRGWAHGRRRGGRSREFFMARFDDAAKEVMVQAQREADSLKHNYVGTEHLLLAVLKRGIEGLDYGVARKGVAERIGEGDEPWIAGLPRPFTPRAKRALEGALTEATAADREQFGPEDILLAIAADPKGTGGEVLAELGATPERLREQLGR